MEFGNEDTRMIKHSSEQVANAIRSVLKSNVIGVYLTGSAVFGDWHYGKSDLDFTVVTNDSIAQETIALLDKQIKPLESKRPSVKLEIQYIPVSVLGKCKEEVKPILAYHDKKHSMSYFNPVTWYTLEKYGAVVWGKPIESFNLNTTQDELSSYVYENVNTYWRAWGSSAAKIFTKKGIFSFTDWAVEWCVCGLSRMYYTLREQDITSKCGALDYMLDNLPQEYQDILQEAKAIRLRSGQRFFSSRAGRRRSMLNYVDHVIGLCQH